MSEPYTPKEAMQAKLAAIPDFVIDAVNALLRDELTEHGRATLTVSDVVSKIVEIGNSTYAQSKNRGLQFPISSGDVFDSKWLDFEAMYRVRGWDVEFFKRPYYDSAPDFYVFTIK